MKIKTICKLTGLTDRTIRYYIEEGLISPFYTENFSGRKMYDFSDKDAKELTDIATLRKFDFTIEEIKTIILDVEKSKSILLGVKKRIEATALNCQEKLTALSQVNCEQSYTVAQLAEELSKLPLEVPSCDETISFNIIQRILSFIKELIISMIVWLPIVLSLFVVLSNEYEYPVFNPLTIAMTVISFVPSITALIISKTKLVYRKALKGIILVLCILSIPICFVFSCGIITKSETTDFRNYRDFDADCLANRNLIFQDLFPNWPYYFETVKQTDGSYETIYLDAKYYYHYHQVMDYTYDIYAEWPLDEAKYNQEIDRVTDLFTNAVNDKIYKYKFSEIDNGDYHCLILYRGDEPFTPATNSYDYIIFAYNEKCKTVRYIYCDSLENGADQPYYLLLDW